MIVTWTQYLASSHSQTLTIAKVNEQGDGARVLSLNIAIPVKMYDTQPKATQRLRFI